MIKPTKAPEAATANAAVDEYNRAAAAMERADNKAARAVVIQSAAGAGALMGSMCAQSEAASRASIAFFAKLYRTCEKKAGPDGKATLQAEWKQAKLDYVGAYAEARGCPEGTARTRFEEIVTVIKGGHTSFAGLKAARDAVKAAQGDIDKAHSSAGKANGSVVPAAVVQANEAASGAVVAVVASEAQAQARLVNADENVIKLRKLAKSVNDNTVLFGQSATMAAASNADRAKFAALVSDVTALCLLTGAATNA